MPTLPARAQIPQGPSRHVYDVIVLGGQLAGALGAALLQKRGYRVLHVEHDGMGHGYAHEGWLLPYAPFVAPPLKALPIAEEALAELGLTTAVQRALKPCHALQLVMPDHRLDLFPDDAKRLQELTREFGEDGAGADAQFREASQQHEGTDAFFKTLPPLPPDGFMEKWRLKQQIAKAPGLDGEAAIARPGPAASLVRGLAPFVHYLAQPNGPLPFTRPLSQALRAPHRFPGGREGLRELFCKKLTDLGGVFLGRDGGENYVAEALAFSGDKLEGLKVHGSDTAYTGAAFVAALDAPALRRLLPEKKRHKKLSDLLDLGNTQKFLFSVNWVIRADAVPRGMGELILLETDDDLGPLLIQVHGARRVDAKADDEAMRVICAGAFVPAGVRDLGEGHLQRLANRISEHLDKLMPFASPLRELVSAPYLDAGGVRGARLLPHPLYSFESDQVLGITGIPQRTPVKNLFLASREVLPGLGLEGEFFAGVRAAQLVQETLHKKDPLKS